MTANPPDSGLPIEAPAAAPATLEASFVERIDQVPAVEWDALLTDDQPFVRHAFLHALEASGSLQARLGWRPQHLLLHAGRRLVAAAPCYLKYNSHGEFVFDWAWAEAYQKHGLAYYPKLLVGVPYTPITGARLLVGSGPQAPRWRRALRTTLHDVAGASALSSVHLNFLDPTDAAALAHDPWLPRSDWQFHWHNAGYRDFADFLDGLQSKKRKNILQERRKLQQAGVEFRLRHGGEIDAACWLELHALYARTFEEKWNTPALTLDFFRRLGTAMPQQVLAVTAHQHGKLLAMALLLRDATRLYGRYWGCWEALPGLHFETCYYQGIEYAIAAGLQVFEPGAQGEHKLARGFLPQRVRSAHHVVRADFRLAIRHAIDQEQRRRREIGAIYREHSPFRAAEPG